ncbi:transposon TX1 putative protein, partial [Trifolium medium]|nr:transposon TX1 putative protein [Trifolium medium]
MPHWPTLDGIQFAEVSTEDNPCLSAPFSMEEVEVGLASYDGNKSPGPDGFNFSFFKLTWSILKDDVLVMFQQFPLGIGDFRSISLLGSLYKLVAKVLASRLATVMDKLISRNQLAFIKGRHLVDRVVAVNEIIDLAKKFGKDCLIFKVDFEKAYDLVLRRSGVVGFVP